MFLIHYITMLQYTHQRDNFRESLENKNKRILRLKQAELG